MKSTLLSITFPGSDGPVEVQPPENIPTDPSLVVGFGLAIFLAVVIFLSFGFVIYGGYNWVMSQGDKTKLESARKTVLYAIIGLVVAFMSFFIIRLVGSALGVDYFNLSI